MGKSSLEKQIRYRDSLQSDLFSKQIYSFNDISQGQNHSVLIVEDDRMTRKMIALSLTKANQNISILQAENGKEALDILGELTLNHQHPPLFIVTDLEMPIMDGWELIKTLKKQYEKQGKVSGIPIIVLSATNGEKGLIFKKSILDGKSNYEPLISVAKEACKSANKFDTQGEKGLSGWVKHFMQYGKKHI